VILRRPAAIFAWLTALAAAALLAVAWQIPVREVDMLGGPRLFPVAVMALLAIVATLTAVFDRTDEASFGPMDRPAVGYVLGGLAVFGALVESAGFVVAEAALFAFVARGFGARQLLLNGAIGLALAGAIFLLFVHGLGLSLPGGMLFSALGPLLR
jgi:putative tricarboxylic transport membrane protein